jgi:ATP-dependent Clp protease protease subunit
MDMKDLENTKLEAEIAKLTSEKLFYDEKTRTQRTIADEAEQKRAEDAASYEENRIYNFFGAVDRNTSAHCIGLLNFWARLEENKERPFTIFFNSPGGSVIDGFALLDTISEIRSRGYTVNTVGIGMIASMAGILLQAGEKRSIGYNSYLMIHELSSVNIGKVSEMEDEMKFLKRLSDRALDILSERSTLSKAQISRRWNRKDWWLDSTEALELGLVDEIVPNVTNVRGT